MSWQTWNLVGMYQRVCPLYWMFTVENCLFQQARRYWLEISNRWMAVSCLLLWYLFIVLMYATRVSPVNLVTMYAMGCINQKQSPQALLFSGCSQPFCLFYTLLFVLDLRQHFYRHHLHPSQVLIDIWTPFYFSNLLNANVNIISLATWKSGCSQRKHQL